jgi:hypothetical protein
MKTSRLFSFVSIFMILVSSGCGLLGKPTEEELFYRDFLAWRSQEGFPSVFVIDEYSTAMLKSDETLGSFLHPIEEENFELPQETIDDFIAKNSVPIQFPADMDLGVKYVLLSESEKDELRKSPQKFWGAFEEKYPGSHGLLTLSRVGFDKEQTHALISFHLMIGSFGGGGYCIFEKEADRWVWKHCIRSWKT